MVRTQQSQKRLGRGGKNAWKNYTRKIFMTQQNLHQISGVAEHEHDFYAEMAVKCPKGFCVKAIANIEKVASMIDRNVNSKMLFCDLVNRMFFNI